MVHCPVCQTQFSAALAVCPVCRSFETPRLDWLRYLASETEKRLENGTPAAQVQEWLVERDLAAAEAETLVRLIQRKLAREVRRDGAWQLLVGVALLGTGFLLLLISWIMSDSLLSRGQLPRGFFYALVAGAFATFIGLLAILNGIAPLVTGRESRIPLPGSLEEYLNQLV